jgi:hypothetical protein
VDVGAQAAQRFFDNELDAHRGCQMEHPVCAGDHAVNRRPVENGAFHEPEARVALHVGQVLQRTGGQVIQHGHLVPRSEQIFGQVAADEPGASGDCCFHFCPQCAVNCAVNLFQRC